MQRVRRVTEQPSLELAPLIDVVFLLLTFFVFSLAMAVQLRITEIQLPTGSAGAEATARTSSLVSLHADGSVRLDDQPVQLEALAEALRAAMAASPGLVVYVATDEAASARDLFRLMDAFSEARISDLRFLRADDPAQPAQPDSTPPLSP